MTDLLVNDQMTVYEELKLMESFKFEDFVAMH
jgi:hypothetical protein